MPKKRGARREHRDESHRVRKTDAEKVPRSWRFSDLEGRLVIDEAYEEGLANIEPGQRIVVIFNFHESPAFSPDLLRQTPPHRRQGAPGVDRSTGIFSICSPVRSNPRGMPVLFTGSRRTRGGGSEWG